MPRALPRPPIVLTVVVVESGLILVALLIGWWAGVSPLDRLDLDWSGLIGGLLATVPPVVLMIWIVRTSMKPVPHVRKEIERLVVPLFRGSTTGDMVLIALMAGLGEELFFRGLLQPGLGAWIGALPALILTSALFGAIHWVTPFYALMAGLMGAYLGAFALLSGNLFVPIIVHVLYDFFALYYLAKQASSPVGDAAAGQFEARE